MLDAGESLDEISVKFKLTTMKPLHTQWVIDLHNQFFSFNSKRVILSAWKVSVILDALTKGLAGFPGGFINPFYNIDPFDQGEVDFNIT